MLNNEEWVGGELLEEADIAEEWLSVLDWKRGKMSGRRVAEWGTGEGCKARGSTCTPYLDKVKESAFRWENTGSLDGDIHMGEWYQNGRGKGNLFLFLFSHLIIRAQTSKQNFIGVHYSGEVICNHRKCLCTIYHEAKDPFCITQYSQGSPDVQKNIYPQCDYS